MRQNNDMTLQYLEEGLVALLPDYGDIDSDGESDGDSDVDGDGGGVGGTQVYTLQGVYGEGRSLFWLVEVLARFYRLDLAAVRRHTGRQLGLSHNIPLPLTGELVLLPVKVRRAAELGEHATGYVNMMQVERVEETAVKKDAGRILFKAAAPNLIRSRIICRGGLVIYCLNKAATVRTKLHQGEMAREELLQRQKVTALPAAPFQGLNGAALKEMLPSCDCLLKSVFLLLLERASRIGSGRKE